MDRRQFIGQSAAGLGLLAGFSGQAHANLQKAEILVIGGEVDPKLVDEYTGKKTKFASYRAIIASAKTQLNWLLSEINRPS